MLYGTIADGARVLDDVLVTVFRAPHSYTGEDAVEISCHGSRYIVRELLALLVRRGARMATPGEFTSRAFLGGKLDLSQAEAVADLIASGSRAAHTLATDQMRGGYSAELETLRGELLRLASLLELELDFGEEEVEFADRTELRAAMERIGAKIDRLIDSFALGNAIKEGVAVAIVGRPNVGKKHAAQPSAQRGAGAGIRNSRHDTRSDRSHAEPRRHSLPVYRYGGPAHDRRRDRAHGYRTCLRQCRPRANRPASVRCRRPRRRDPSTSGLTNAAS